MGKIVIPPASEEGSPRSPVTPLLSSKANKRLMARFAVSSVFEQQSMFPPHAHVRRANVIGWLRRKVPPPKRDMHSPRVMHSTDRSNAVTDGNLHGVCAVRRHQCHRMKFHSINISMRSTTQQR